MKASPTQLNRMLLGCGLLTLSIGVTAQQAAEADDKPAPSEAAAPTTDKLETVVVTAQRRKQSLQKAPVAVTALGETQLVELGARSVVDIAAQVPTLQISQSGQVTLRGVGTASTNENADPTVAPHVDGIYLARPSSMMAAGLFDVERVEVLRGPQGTLYGRNATSGSMNVITHQPAFNESGALWAEVGNHGQRLFGGYMNQRLGKQWAIRVAAQSNDHADYVPASGTSTLAGGADSANSQAMRLSMLYKPGADFSAILRLDGVRDSGVNYQYGAVAVAADGSFQRVSATRLPARNDNRHRGGSLELNWNTAVGTLTYVGSRRQTNEDGQTELTAFNNRVVGRMDDTSSQHELRLAGDTGALQYVAGLFYFHETNNTDFRFDFGGCCGFPWAIANTSKAAYTQATYSITPELRATVGLRRTNDYKERLGGVHALGPDLTTGPLIAASDSRGDWSRNNYRLGFEADLSPTSMLYANVSTGYKAGGANDNGTVYNPELIDAVEVGWKNRLFSNTLQINVAAFDYQYKDLQLQRLLATQAVTLNAGKASSRGLEIEGVWRLTDDDKIDASLALLRARYTDFVEVTSAGTTDYSGHRLAKAPTSSINLGYQHRFDLDGAGLTARLQTHRESPKYLHYTNTAASLQKAFTKTDFVLTYEPPSGKWNVMGYVRNIENKDVMTDFFLNAGAPNERTANLAPPRLFGVRFESQF
ncbi:MAG TPA: TonB-dependent receptor [Roseateles sp.]